MLLATPAAGEALRLALFNSGLGREGPGLLLRAIERGEADVQATVEALARLRPDAILLLDIDYDRDGRALAAFAARLAEAGLALPHSFAPLPNRGLASGRDLDGDGRSGGPGDAQGWGRFSGTGGMALLSRLPIARESLRDHSALLWRDLPGATLPRRADGTLFPDPEAYAVQRLSRTGAWEIALETPAGPLVVMAYHATPPLSERDWLRGADETAFWRQRLDGAMGPLPTRFVLMGCANLDPEAGDGARGAIAALLAHPALRDPRPSAPLPRTGRPGTATADWPRGPGALRVDYLLPSAGLALRDAGMVWPEGARHAILWVDLEP